MTQSRRLILAGAITILTALAAFAVVANTGAFRGSDTSSAPPVDVSVDGTAFVSEEPSLANEQGQFSGESGAEAFEGDDARLDDEDRGSADHDGHQAESEHEEDDDDD